MTCEQEFSARVLVDKVSRFTQFVMVLRADFIFVKIKFNLQGELDRAAVFVDHDTFFGARALVAAVQYTVAVIVAVNLLGWRWCLFCRWAPDCVNHYAKRCVRTLVSHIRDTVTVAIQRRWWRWCRPTELPVETDRRQVVVVSFVTCGHIPGTI